MHLLIPYIYIPGHNDPAFDEFTYGDVKSRGRKLQNELSKGDFVIFHTSKAGKKYITAYFVVDRVLDIHQTCRERAIVDKYNNPHILEFLEREGPSQPDEFVLFGDPIESRVLRDPLPFVKALAEKLSLNIHFPTNRSEAQTIGSATRAWRKLIDEDIEVILDAIKEQGETLPEKQGLRSTEEVSEVLEKDIESLIANTPDLLGKNLSLLSRQADVVSGRTDLIFQDKDGDLLLIEVKLGRIGRDAVRQLKRYLHDLRKHSSSDVRGMIIGSGVMHAYEADLLKEKEIDLYIYGWQLKTKPWKRR